MDSVYKPSSLKQLKLVFSMGMTVPQESPENHQGSILYNFFGINYIKIYVIQGKIYLVESIFVVIDAKIGFIGLTPSLILEE